MELSDRKLKILQAIIDDYIDAGVPVGSRTLSKKDGLTYSSATIRNEMADLEELGYLEKPHTSAGRTPSDAAYRLYVDRLLRVDRLSREETAFISKYFDTRMNEIHEVLDNAAKALSDSTNHIALITEPNLQEVTIVRVQLVKITENKAMLIFVTDNGIVRDTVINVSQELTPDHMERLSNMLTEMVRNVSIASVSDVIHEMSSGVLQEQKGLMDQIMTAIDASRDKKNMIMEGAQKIFNYPEYKDIDKARHFLQLLETKDMLFTMLSNTEDFECTIKIGSENNNEDFREMSVVTATYKLGGKNIGSYGVIGPTRMDYSRVVSVLKYIGMSINDILASMVQGEKK
ncbi:MAG: heat-inducible transcriptional repressor HrcA [Christensenellaceae bacterium]|jgi:heat-inducible transcriptional repressor